MRLKTQIFPLNIGTYMAASDKGSRSAHGDDTFKDGKFVEKRSVQVLTLFDNLIEEQGSALVYCEYGDKYSSILVAAYLLAKLDFPQGSQDLPSRVAVVIEHLSKMRPIVSFTNMKYGPLSLDIMAFFGLIISAVDDAFSEVNKRKVPRRIPK